MSRSSSRRRPPVGPTKAHRLGDCTQQLQRPRTADSAEGVDSSSTSESCVCSIPTAVIAHPPLGSARRGYKPGHSSCRPLSPCNNLRVCLSTCQVLVQISSKEGSTFLPCKANGDVQFLEPAGYSSAGRASACRHLQLVSGSIPGAILGWGIFEHIAICDMVMGRWHARERLFPIQASARIPCVDVGGRPDGTTDRRSVSGAHCSKLSVQVCVIRLRVLSAKSERPSRMTQPGQLL
jgi:hypothetical protein